MNSSTGMKKTDEQMLCLLNDDPEEGIRLLMEQYMGLLWSACRLYLDDPEDIRECLQDILTDFYENRNRFYPEKGTLKAYLYVIARRKALRKAGQNGQYRSEPLPEELPDGKDETEQILNRVMLEQAMQTLREEDSRMIRMKYYDGMSCAQIARTMELPLETVKKRQQRSLKKLRRILAVLAVLGLLTACAAAVVCRVRFSPRIGLRGTEEECIYELADGPVTVETAFGNVTVESLIWEEQNLYIQMEFANTGLEPEHLEDAVCLLDPDTGQEYRSSRSHISTGGALPAQVMQSWRVWDAKEQYHIRIFETEHTFDMNPVKEYEDFDQIGKSRTYRGRTIVIRPSREEGRFLADAYVYSEDSWDITGIGEGLRTDWSTGRILDGKVFHYEAEAEEDMPYVLDIDMVVLQYTEEIPVLKIPLPTEETAVDLTFQAGEDRYRITRVSRSRGTCEWIQMDEDGTETKHYGDEILIEVAPVSLEADTRFLGATGELGIMAEGKRWRRNPDTGRMEEIGSTESFRSQWGGSLMLPEPVIRIPVARPEELPEEAYLSITGIYKYWDQTFHFIL